MGEIENVSDQLIGYAEEAATAIEHIRKNFDITEESACMAVLTAALSMRNDVIWKRLKTLNENLESLQEGIMCRISEV